MRRAAKPPRPSDTPPMLGGEKPPRPSDTPPMLGGEKAALPLGGGTPSKGLLSNLPVSLLIGGKGGCIPPNRREEARPH
jgi:hypothetical protein